MEPCTSKAQPDLPTTNFENSPSEEFLAPLLADAPMSSALNPVELITPQSFAGGIRPEATATSPATPGKPSPDAPTSTAKPSGEKRPAKKRKSWGQVLPEPKTNLPPRKRAKTEDEKEQRRVERVLRNRRAAQSSRERKRLEVEALEQRNRDLEAALARAHKTNIFLLQELENSRRDSGVSTSFDTNFRPTTMTLSPGLFPSQDAQNIVSDPSLIDELIMAKPTPTDNTVDPASLSPAETPMPEDPEPLQEMADGLKDAPAATPAAAAEPTPDLSPDVTQHPAELLCSDLPCQSEEMSPWLAVSLQQPLFPALALCIQLRLLLACSATLASICLRPLTQIAMSMRASFPLPPTVAILNTIIWLVTRPSPSNRSPSTSTTSSSRTTATPSSTTPSRSTASSQPNTSRSPRRKTSLRLKTLRKILASNPACARPLLGAAAKMLRLVSTNEGRELDRDVIHKQANGNSAATAPDGQGRWRGGLPSKHVLLTLMYAIQVEQRKIQVGQRTIQIREKHDISSVSSAGPGQILGPRLTASDSRRFVLELDPKQRRDQDLQTSRKRFRLGG